MKKLEAAGHYVLVRPDAIKEKHGDIYIPETAQDAAKRNMYKGSIVSIGPIAFKDFIRPWGAEVGDRVVFAKAGSFNIDADPEEIRDPSNELIFAINDEDVIAVYRESNESGQLS